MAKKMKATKHEDGRKVMLYLPKSIKPDYRDWGTQTFVYTFVLANDSTDQVRNPSNSFRSEFGYDFADLSFRAQASADMNDGKPFGADLCYRNVHCVDMERSEAMLSMLKRIRKVIEAFPVQPASYGQYIQLVCLGLGVQGAACATSDSSGWHSETQHTYWKPTEIAWLVDNQVNTFLADHKEAMERERARR